MNSGPSNFGRPFFVSLFIFPDYGEHRLTEKGKDGMQFRRNII
jgi:hypothetical protein